MSSAGPPPRGVNAHYAIAAVAITVLINRRKDIKLIPGLLARNGGKTRKVGWNVGTRCTIELVLLGSSLAWNNATRKARCA